jgi:GntR family transcriptional regulator, transcriptional repressor for pyruvate dehydrogenase complex
VSIESGPLSEHLSLPPHRGRAESLADLLAARIKEAGLGSGDRVGDLEELRRSTGLGRATVSAAVRLLRERSVLEIRPGRAGGLFVAETSPLVRLRHTLLQVTDAVPVADAIEIRESLEELVDVDASRYCDSEDSRELRALIEGLRAAVPAPSTFMAANWALHRRIAAIAKNRAAAAVYLAMLEFVADAAEDYTSDDPDWPSYARERCAVHEALVDAVVAGDHIAVRQAVHQHRSPRP